jgi:hypothetical protein
MDKVGVRGVVEVKKRMVNAKMDLNAKHNANENAVVECKKRCNRV